MMQSEQIDQLAIALAAFQAEIEPVDKNAINPHFKKKYADISAIISAIRKVLPNYGLAYTQTMKESAQGYVCVSTTLLHKSGQWISGDCHLPCQQNTPQGAGSAITYARRYSLAAILGIASEDDDDANGAMPDKNEQNAPRQQYNKPRQQAPQSHSQQNASNAPQLATESQVKAIRAIFYKKYGNSNSELLHNEMAKFFGRQVVSSKDISKREASDYIESLNAKPDFHIDDSPF